MNKKVFFGHNDLRFYYYRYKDSSYYSLSVFIATIAVCILLVFTVIIPQAGVYFSIRKEAVAIRLKIQTINDNINFVNNLDKSVLDSQLQTVSRALPADKDFAGIINAITASAVRSGVSISDYNFKLDELAPAPDAVKEASESAVIPIKVIFDIEGSSDGGKKFLSEISEKIPLVEVSSVKGDSETITINLQFFYKSLPNLSFQEDERISPISDSKQELLRKLSSWERNSSSFDQETTSPVGSSSAMPLF